MSLAGQEGKNCLCISSNKLFMQFSDLALACLRRIVHSIFPLLDSLLLRMLLLMKAQSHILLRRITLVQATFKANRLGKLFNLVFALMQQFCVHQQAYLCLPL